MNACACMMNDNANDILIAMNRLCPFNLPMKGRQSLYTLYMLRYCSLRYRFHIDRVYIVCGKTKWKLSSIKLVHLMLKLIYKWDDAVMLSSDMCMKFIDCLLILIFPDYINNLFIVNKSFDIITSCVV